MKACLPGIVLLVLLALLGSAALAGCGGGGGDLYHCGRVEPCGGDVFGNWELVHGCVNEAVAAAEVMTALGPSCRGVISGSTTSSSGTLTFMADLTYATDAQFGGIAAPFIPESCRAGRSCAELQTALGLEGLPVQECRDSGTGCECAIELVQAQFRPAGTYLTTDTTLELHPEGSPAWSRQYCVTGSQLHITGTNGSTFLDDMVFEKL